MQRTIAATLLALALLLGAAAQSTAETCEYDTEWGVLVMELDWQANTATGHYPYKNGSIQGRLTRENGIEGVWRQSDGSGDFFFSLHQNGFKGKWRISGDTKWRGSWDGTLRGCY